MQSTAGIYLNPTSSRRSRKSAQLLSLTLHLAAQLHGTGSVLTLYGLDDTVLDLFYNTLGGLLVALFGTVYLTGVADELAGRLEAGRAKR
ncbi:hypothetical protein [Haloarchaeobius sp. TZWWS8]|uniref:hypothetical protein n=1 Tax=Haloarchaeobius sp. TZWWS8 TaxID=3446121 RepID=UPI003EB9B6A5